LSTIQLSSRASAPTRTRRRGSGRAPYRNEVKTRLSDDEYDALLRYQAIHGVESISAALGRCVRLSLFGVIGMLPTNISGLSEEVAQNGPGL
jgi:hypothetical protein